uniref:Nucleolar protein 16 n=1 Tax=Plectus sambesii TaxID=2011161 RepID=A0A914V5G1_9BILA
MLRLEGGGGGGLAAVMYVETLQCFMMVGSAILLAIFSFIEVGGYGSLVTKYKALGDREDWGNSSCGRPNPKAFTMLRGPSDPDYPWPGFLFGQSPASVWYWAADQMMVQRALAAKNLSHAQGATIFAGVLKVLPLFVIVFPGMISRVLYPEVVGCVDDCLARCGNADGCSNTAYPMLVMNLMPNGLRGVMLAGMLAALMSDLASVFNSSSTLFTLDIWRRMRPLATNAEVMIVGRIFVIVMVVVAVLWVPIVSGTQGAQLYIYIQSVAADLAPPIAAVYLLAILWRRTNEQGAFSGLLVGAVLGGGRLISDFIYRAPKCGETDNRPWFVGRVQYMYFALALFVIVAMTTVIVSLLTEPPEQFRLVRTTFWTRFDSAVRSDEETSVSTAALKYEETVELQEIGEVRPDGRRFSVEKEDAVIPDSQCDNSGGMSSFGRICVWFCGFNASTAFEQGQKSPERPAELSSLEQTAFERRVLTAALVAILALAYYLLTDLLVCSSKLNHPVRMRSVKHGGKKQTRYRYKRNTTNAKSKAMKKKKENQTNCPEVAAQWNKRWTLKQNMDNMGLAYDVNKSVKAPKPKAKKDVVEDVPMEEVAEVSSVAHQKAEANKKKETKKAEKETKGKKGKAMEVVEEPMIQEPQPSKPQTKEPEHPKEKEQKKDKQKEKQKEVEQPKPQASQQKEQKKGKKGAPAVHEEEQAMDAEESVAPPVVVNHVGQSAKQKRTEETTAAPTTPVANNNNNNEKIKKQASTEKADKKAKNEKTKPAAVPAATTNEAPKGAEKASAPVDKPKPVIAALEKAAAEEEARQKKERMYRLLPQDILFCTRMMETHTDDFEAMARDSRNVYQDTAKQIQRKIRIFRESPQFQLYLEAKKEGKAFPNGDIEAK